MCIRDRADIEELNARKATIKAKAAVAKTQSKVNEMTSALSLIHI